MELEELSYTEKWIAYGILDEKNLKNQYIEFTEGEDKNTEHFRYTTFMNWLKAKEAVTDIEIQNIIMLALEDPDQLMSSNAVRYLLTNFQTTDDQFECISKEFSKFGEWTKKVIERERRKRKEHNS